VKKTFDITRDAGWKKLEKTLSSSNKGIINKHVKRSTLLNGKIAEAEIRNEIKNGEFTSNAQLTTSIKGENKPLVGTSAGAQLFQSITSTALDDNTVFVGVLKTNGFYDIAKTIHNGVSMKVTPAMRGLFFMLWQASSGAISPSELSERGQELFSQKSTGWWPLKKTTNQIVIPPRPFIEQAMEKSKLQSTMVKNWTQAMGAAFREIKGQA
jgi:hypothetical protein